MPKRTKRANTLKEMRIEAVYHALERFCFKMDGDHDELKYDPQSVVTDLLADLAYWCEEHGLDLFECWERAGGHYHEETDGKGVQFHAK